MPYVGISLEWTWLSNGGSRGSLHGWNGICTRLWKARRETIRIGEKKK